MERIVAFALSTRTLAGAAMAAPPEKPTGLCAATEQSYFSCRTTRSRWIGLCGNSPRQLHYRFGTLRRIDLDYPASGDRRRPPFLYAHYMRYRTERVEVRFRNGNADYAVFDYREGRSRRAGVRVATDEGRETEFPCIGTIDSRLDALAGALPCDTDNALNGGSCPENGQE